MASDGYGNFIDRLAEADTMADQVYGRSEGGSDTETLAMAMRELIAEVRALRNRIALLDGGDGMT